MRPRLISSFDARRSPYQEAFVDGERPFHTPDPFSARQVNKEKASSSHRAHTRQEKHTLLRVPFFLTLKLSMG